MITTQLRVARTISELAGLPIGTRIVTSTSKILELDMIETVTKRKDAGERYWIEPGTLQPYSQPLVHWLPALILPPVDHAYDGVTETMAVVAQLRGVLRLISPDHITPTGVRMIEKILDAHAPE